MMNDLPALLGFYQLVINETEDMPVHARWVYGQHPTEEMITNYVRQGNMYCSEDGTDICAAVTVTPYQTDDYHGIDWILETGCPSLVCGKHRMV